MDNLKSFVRWLTTYPELFLLGLKMCRCGSDARTEQEEKKEASQVRQKAEQEQGLGWRDSAVVSSQKHKNPSAHSLWLTAVIPGVGRGLGLASRAETVSSGFCATLTQKPKLKAIEEDIEP